MSALLQKIRGRQLDYGLIASSGTLFVVFDFALDRIRAARERRMYLDKLTTSSNEPNLIAETAFTYGAASSLADYYDRFGQDARRVLESALKEAERLGANRIGTEHLLLALVGDTECQGAKVLGDFGIIPERVRNVTSLIGGDAGGSESGLTPRAKRVLELAIEASRRYRSDMVGTIHLLFGLIDEGENTAMSVLRSLDVTAAQIRKAAERRV